MKHFMHPQTAILRKVHSTDPLSSPSPSSAKPRPYQKAKSAKENAPPFDPNSMAYDLKQSPATAVKLKSQLPPRPPSSNSLNMKLIMETVELWFTNLLQNHHLIIITTTSSSSQNVEEEKHSSASKSESFLELLTAILRKAHSTDPLSSPSPSSTALEPLLPI
ncbi:Kinesin-like protein KIN12B [Fagus crenata]